MEIKVSIIIVNYNSSKYTEECVKSILRNEHTDNYEIIIVDNNSDNKNKNILNKSVILNDKRIKIILSENNLGFGSGNNKGVNEASGEYILLLNTDTILKNSVLDFCVNRFEEEKNIGILGLQLLYFNESLQASYGYFPSIGQEIFELIPFKIKKCFEKISKPLATTLNRNEAKKSVDYVSGAFMFMKKDIYNKVNGFDKSFFMYFEETDLCKRVRDLGFENIIYNNKSIKHKGGGSIGAFSENKAKVFIESKLKYLEIHNANTSIKKFIKINAYIKEKVYGIKLKFNIDNKLILSKSNYWKIIRQKCK